MKKYFQLFEECLLVNNSEKEGALYSLLDGDVYKYNISETNILALCEKKESIDNIHRITNLPLKTIIVFLDKLADANLGFYSDKPVYIEKMLVDYNWFELSYMKERPTVERAYILLNSKCNCNCFYCNDNYIRLNNCMGCFKDSISNEETTTYDEYIGALKKLKLLGAKEIYFSGGNFFQDFYRNIKIVEQAKQLQFSITLFLGCNERISKEYLEILKELHINICIQITVFDKKSIHDNLLINSINGVIPFSIILLFGSTNNTQFEKDIIEYCQETLTPIQIYIDLIINKNQIDSVARKDLHALRRTSIQDYSFSHIYSKCMYGLLTITAHKTVSVCPRISDPLGEISNFAEAMSSEKLHPYWKLSKDKVNQCKTCSIRYICSDCRYMEKELFGNMYENHLCLADN